MPNISNKEEKIRDLFQITEEENKELNYMDEGKEKMTSEDSMVEDVEMTSENSMEKEVEVMSENSMEKDVEMMSENSMMNEEKLSYSEEKQKKVQETELWKSPRFLLLVGMSIYIAAIVVWGLCGNIRNINLQTKKANQENQTTQVVQNNSKNSGKTLDTKELVDKLLQGVRFESQLKLVDQSVAKGMVTSAYNTKIQIYMGTGTYSDEILIMTAQTEKAAKQNQENVKKHLEEVKQSFKDYIPKEAKKVDNAVMIRCGTYVIACISPESDTARDIIDNALKQ